MRCTLYSAAPCMEKDKIPERLFASSPWPLLGRGVGFHAACEELLIGVARIAGIPELEQVNILKGRALHRCWRKKHYRRQRRVGNRHDLAGRCHRSQLVMRECSADRVFSLFGVGVVWRRNVEVVAAVKTKGPVLVVPSPQWTTAT